MTGTADAPVTMPSRAPEDKEQFKRRQTPRTLFDPAIIRPAIAASFKKLDPRGMAKNPVMFVVEIVSVVVTIIFVRDGLAGRGGLGFTGQVTAWLWFTVLFANFAEAMAEGRGK